MFLEFSDKTVILYKLCYTPYISCSVPSPKEYGIKCTKNVLFDVIQVTFILIGLLYYWSLLLYISIYFLLAGADVCFQMLVAFQNFSMNIVVECRELYSHTLLKCGSCWQRFWLANYKYKMWVCVSYRILKSLYNVNCSASPKQFSHDYFII